MSLRPLIRSTPFRHGLLYLGLFGGSALLLIGVLYWSTAGYVLREADATIESEITSLADRYRSSGVLGLSSWIRARVARRPAGSSIYLLAAPDLEFVAGNLDRWPATAPDTDGWIEFHLEDPASGTSLHRARAKVFLLPGGFHLLVGRDMHDLEAARRALVNTLGWGLGATWVLALGGAIVLGRGRLRRIASVNQAMHHIMEGDLSRRIPGTGAGDDIDELVEGINRMLDEIERLMEEVRRVSDSIAHDLRTPLTILRNRLETLRDVTLPEEELRASVERAQEAADGLLKTFGALLRIARIESDRRAGFAPTDLARVLDDVAELYGPLAEESGRRLERRPSPSVTVSADRDLIFQAIANIVDNAIKFTPPGGTITMECRDDDGNPEIVIADGGPGIPPEEREQVFRRFYRMESHRASAGSGLGLSVVAAVAHLHGATIRLEDNDPGLRFRLGLPSRQPIEPGRNGLSARRPPASAA